MNELLFYTKITLLQLVCCILYVMVVGYRDNTMMLNGNLLFNLCFC